MKMKAKKEQNEQIMTEFFLDLIMISKKTFFIALCKALGLCSKFITAPFWRIMEGDCTL